MLCERLRRRHGKILSCPGQPEINFPSERLNLSWKNLIASQDCYNPIFVVDDFFSMK